MEAEWPVIASYKKELVVSKWYLMGFELNEHCQRRHRWQSQAWTMGTDPQRARTVRNWTDTKKDNIQEWGSEDIARRKRRIGNKDGGKDVWTRKFTQLHNWIGTELAESCTASKLPAKIVTRGHPPGHSSGTRSWFIKCFRRWCIDGLLSTFALPLSWYGRGCCKRLAHIKFRNDIRFVLPLWNSKPQTLLPSWHLKKLIRCTSHKPNCQISLIPNHQFGTTSVYWSSNFETSFEWHLHELVPWNPCELWIAWSSFGSSLWVIPVPHNLLGIFLHNIQTCTISHFQMTACTWNVWSMEYTYWNLYNPFSSSKLASRYLLQTLETLKPWLDYTHCGSAFQSSLQ